VSYGGVKNKNKSPSRKDRCKPMTNKSFDHDDVVAFLRVISILTDRIACWMQKGGTDHVEDERPGSDAE
jgi:hypothetical protein